MCNDCYDSLFFFVTHDDEKRGRLFEPDSRRLGARNSKTRSMTHSTTRSMTGVTKRERDGGGERRVYELAIKSRRKTVFEWQGDD